MKATQQRNKLDLLCLLCPLATFQQFYCHWCCTVCVVQRCPKACSQWHRLVAVDRTNWTYFVEHIISHLDTPRMCVCVYVSAGACFKQTPFSWSPFALALEGRTFWYSQTSLGKHRKKKVYCSKIMHFSQEIVPYLKNQVFHVKDSFLCPLLPSDTVLDVK